MHSTYTGGGAVHGRSPNARAGSKTHPGRHKDIDTTVYSRRSHVKTHTGISSSKSVDSRYSERVIRTGEGSGVSKQIPKPDLTFYVKESKPESHRKKRMAREIKTQIQTDNGKFRSTECNQAERSGILRTNAKMVDYTKPVRPLIGHCEAIQIVDKTIASLTMTDGTLNQKATCGNHDNHISALSRTPVAVNRFPINPRQIRHFTFRSLTRSQQPPRSFTSVAEPSGRSRTNHQNGRTFLHCRSALPPPPLPSAATTREQNLVKLTPLSLDIIRTSTWSERQSGSESMWSDWHGPPSGGRSNHQQGFDNLSGNELFSLDRPELSIGPSGVQSRAATRGGALSSVETTVWTPDIDDFPGEADLDYSETEYRPNQGNISCKIGNSRNGSSTESTTDREVQHTHDPNRTLNFGSLGTLQGIPLVNRPTLNEKGIYSLPVGKDTGGIEVPMDRNNGKTGSHESVNGIPGSFHEGKSKNLFIKHKISSAPENADLAYRRQRIKNGVSVIGGTRSRDLQILSVRPLGGAPPLQRARTATYMGTSSFEPINRCYSTKSSHEHRTNATLVFAQDEYVGFQHRKFRRELGKQHKSREVVESSNRL